MKNAESGVIMTDSRSKNLCPLVDTGSIRDRK